MTEIEKYLQNCDEIAQKVLFISSQNAHPIWDDAKDVLDKAVKQILTDQSKSVAGEIVAFIGVQTPLPTLYSLGFLITNKYIFIQTKASMFSAAGSGDVLDLGSENSSKAYEIFEQKCEFIVPSEMKAAMKKTLNDVLEIMAKFNGSNFKNEGLNLDDILLKFSLDSVLLKPDTKPKILKKAAKVFELKNVKFFALDEMIFSLSKPFGVIIDENGLASRELSEQAKYSTWDEIAKHKATLQDKGNIAIGDTIHKLPIQLEPLGEKFVTFLNLISEKIVNKILR